jgi:hypothetical protein
MSGEIIERHKQSLESWTLIHGNGSELRKPMSLCFFEGPDGGIGIPFGKNPEKVPGEEF